MKIRKATLFDLNRLIALRTDYFKFQDGLDPGQEAIIGAPLKKYFLKHIPNGDFIAILAEDEGKIASAAFMVLTELPAGPDFITGITATISNVITYPEYRRRGLCTRVLLALIEEAKKLDVSMLDLVAAPDGKLLYKKLGFHEAGNSAMRMYL